MWQRLNQTAWASSTLFFDTEIPEAENQIAPFWEKLLISAALLLALVLIRWLVLRIVERRIENGAVLFYWRKISGYFIIVLGLLLVSPIWFEYTQSLTTYIGLISAGLAIALQRPLTNFVGWMFLMWQRPLVVGDRVQIGDNVGDVIDLQMFEFSLMEIRNWVDADQPTGRILHIPNGMVFEKPLANYTRGLPYIWHEEKVILTFESDWQKAKALLLVVLNKYAIHLDDHTLKQMRHVFPHFKISRANLSEPVVYVCIGAYGLELTMRYLCEPRKRRAVRSHIIEEILLVFAEESSINLAYQTQRLFISEMPASPQHGLFPNSPV
jgi:small-conductance mechanosensitive channel